VYPAGAPLGFEQISLATTSVGLTVPAGATYALVAVTGSNATWCDDGMAPTAMANLQALKFISVSGSATLDVSFYK